MTKVGVVTPPAVTEKVVEVEPCGIVMVDGIATSAGDEPRLMAAPPLPAAAVSATVQVDPVDGFTASGVHEKPLRAGTIVTTPPLLAIARDVAPVAAPTSLANWSGEEVSVVEVETVRDIVATTPLGIVASFRPDTMHRDLPSPVAQLTDLFAPMATGPAAMVTDEKSTVE